MHAYVRKRTYLHLASILRPSTLSHSEPRQTQFQSSPMQAIKEYHEGAAQGSHHRQQQHVRGVRRGEGDSEIRELTLTSLAYIFNLEWRVRAMV